MDNKASSSIHLPKEMWSQVWKLKVLPKINHFIWRCLVGAIPVKEKLFKRKCCSSEVCPVCEKELETLEHALFLCPWTRGVWFGCRMTLRVENEGINNLGEWWGRRITTEKILDEHQLAHFAWILWLIWKERNRLAFEHKRPDPLGVIHGAEIAVEEYREAKGWYSDDRNKVRVVDKCDGWKAPGPGIVKINCDGSYALDMAAIGVLCRNDKGEFLWGFAEKVRAESAIVAEVLALRKALRLLKEFDSIQTIIEVDCAEVFWCCMKKSTEGMDWRGRWEMQEVISILAEVTNVEITLVPRKSNRAADWIAVSCNKGVCPIGWVLKPTPLLNQILELDAKVEDAAVKGKEVRSQMELAAQGRKEKQVQHETEHVTKGMKKGIG